MSPELVDTPPARWRRLAIRYATALHEAGATAANLEEAVVRLLAARGLEGTVMATPTALWIDVDGARVVRLAPAGSHLARLSALGALARRVEVEPDLTDALFEAELRRIATSPVPWGPWVERAALLAAGAGVAVAMGGAAADALAAALLTVVVAEVHGRVRSKPRTSRLADGTAGLLAGVGAQLLAASGADPARTALAAVTLLAPGLALTTAAEETASGHWTSGTARLGGAVVTLVQLAVGLALGATLLPAVPAVFDPMALPALAPVVAHLALAPVVAVLSRVRAWDLLPVAAIAGLAALPTHLLVAPWGALVGAILVTLLGGFGSRLTGTPAGVFQAPALLLLVPGALGVAGLRAAIAGGPGTAWAVGGAVLAIVVGMAIGNALAGRGEALPSTPARSPA